MIMQGSGNSFGISLIERDFLIDTCWRRGGVRHCIDCLLGALLDF